MTQAAAREDARPLLTPTEVAELANVSRKIVYCEIDRGELRAVHIGRLLRVDPTDLDRGRGDRMSPAPVDRTCAARNCAVAFEPAVWNQIYHAPSCGKRVENAKARGIDPAETYPPVPFDCAECGRRCVPGEDGVAPHASRFRCRDHNAAGTARRARRCDSPTPTAPRLRGPRPQSSRRATGRPSCHAS